VNTLAFVDDRDGIVPVIDGRRLDDLIGESGWAGLWDVEAPVVARLVQGWRPSHLGRARAEFRPVGEPIGRGDGRALQPVEPITKVLATLPGGDHPELEASEVDLDGYPGVPIMGCGCGGGIGCAALDAEISFSRNRVLWVVRDHQFEFHRGRYDAAVQDFLRLVGEAPVLISDDEWSSPTPTRVVPTYR
jgi:hypothetical protein